MKNIFRHSGFTLVEILIAIAMLGTVSLGVMQLIKSMSQSQVKYNADSETALITNEIVAILSDPANCMATLGTKNAANTPGGVITSISHKGTSKYIVSDYYGTAQVKINSYSLSASDSDVSIASKTTKLIINFDRKMLQAGTGDIIKKIRMYVDVDGSGGITGCRSLSSSSTDIWTRGTGGEIYYNGGNVGIGSSNPAAPLDVVTVNNGTTGGVRVRTSTGDSSPAYLQFTDNLASFELANIYADKFKNLHFSTNALKALMITNSGDVGIGVFPPTSKLDINGNVKAATYYGTSFQYTSDLRLKKNIESLEEASSIVKKLRPVKFQWKKTNNDDIGFIAQEVEKVIPAITSEDGENIKRVDYAKIVPILVKALQEQQIEIEALKKRINEN